MAEFRCNDCGFITNESKLLTARNPFDGSQYILGCPECYSVEDFTNICDEPDCDDVASGGWPTDNGYRRTCSEHSPN